jgi:cohesin complex subunit SA-1/2
MLLFKSTFRAATSLAKEDVSPDNIRYELVEYMVHSLMAMEQHRSLVTNWTAMLKALQDDGSNEDPRMNTIKQRIIMHMLIAAAELASFAGSVQTFYKSADVDPALIEMEEDKYKRLDIPKIKQGKKNLLSHQDDFSEAFVSTLHQLLVRFKGNTHIIRYLTRLPRYFAVDTFNMPNQKKNYMALIGDVSALFLELTDTEILRNCAFILTAFARASHSRAGEALLQLTKIACALRDRMLELITKKRNLVTNEADTSEICDVENSKSLCLRRLEILAKLWDIADLLGNGSTESGDVASRRLCNHVAKDLEFELQARVVTWEEIDDDSESLPQQLQPVISATWDFDDDRIHGIVADSVESGLVLFYMIMAWRLTKELDILVDEQDEDYDESQLNEHIVIYLRDQIVKLLCICFEQQLHVEEHGEGTFSAAHISFASNVIMHAHNVSGDLFLLLPNWMHDAKSPLLRNFSLANVEEKTKMLRGGMLRFAETMDEQVSRFCIFKVACVLRPVLKPLHFLIATDCSRFREGGQGFDARSLVAFCSFRVGQFIE